jgi:uncharacterized membrane protein YbhN (UPF0104 family)
MTWRALTRNVLAVPRARLVAAFVFTALNYLVMVGYDLLAFAYIGRAVSRPAHRLRLVHRLPDR